jgi:hypothetical protein
VRRHDSFVGLNLQEETAALYTMTIQNNRWNSRLLVTEKVDVLKNFPPISHTLEIAGLI